jgi:hypothetical protein
VNRFLVCEVLDTAYPKAWFTVDRDSPVIDDARLKVVRKMYAMRFGEPAPERRSIEQLRGIEGARVKRLYELQAQENGITCGARRLCPLARPCETGHRHPSLFCHVSVPRGSRSLLRRPESAIEGVN